MINAPAVVVALIGVLVAVHALRAVVGDPTDLSIVLALAFVPARLAAWLHPDEIAAIVARAADTFPEGSDASRMALARLVLGEGELLPWAFVTYALLHGTWSHLALNALWLLAFGSPVARRLGAWRFLLLGGVAAVAGAGAHALTHAEDLAPMIGASGAISGYMAAATRFVFRRDVPLVLLRADRNAADSLPAPGLLEVLSDRRVMIFVLLWFGTNLIFGLVSVPLGITDASVAWEAHVGGFLAGLSCSRCSIRCRARSVAEPDGANALAGRAGLAHNARSAAAGRGAFPGPSSGPSRPRDRGGAHGSIDGEGEMTVAHILAAKGREVVTIQPHRTLDEAARLLAEKRIGSIVVTGADRAVLGILSERDVVRVLARDGAGALAEPVSRCMTVKVVTCTSASGITELMEKMTHGKFRHVPVVEEGRLEGIVSIGDVIKHRLAEIEAEHRAMREYIAMA